MYKRQDRPYTEEQRTYVVSSNNKAFIEGMGGYSIYASSLDGSDKCVRLEAYMADEHGGKDGWKIEKCYVKDDSNREMLDIIAGKFFIAYAPIESEKFLSMPKELTRKYEEKFKYPERFYKSMDGIEAVSYTHLDVYKRQVLAQLGFQEGNLLEPSCGIGHFIGMLPKSMENAKVYGVELDTISADVYKRQSEYFAHSSFTEVHYEQAKDG